MIRTTAIIAASLALAGCGFLPSSRPVTATPRNPAICEALRPAMPISYSSSKDTAETVKGVRQANARFASACP